MTKTEHEIDREVIAAATEGPWEGVGLIAESACREVVGENGNAINNQIFIARARDRWPAALDELDRLRALFARREEMPYYCEKCVMGIAEVRRLEWDGETLRCPHCGVDALEGDDGA